MGVGGTLRFNGHGDNLLRESMVMSANELAKLPRPGKLDRIQFYPDVKGAISKATSDWLTSDAAKSFHDDEDRTLPAVSAAYARLAEAWKVPYEVHTGDAVQPDIEPETVPLTGKIDYYGQASAMASYAPDARTRGHEHWLLSLIDDADMEDDVAESARPGGILADYRPGSISDNCRLTFHVDKERPRRTGDSDPDDILSSYDQEGISRLAETLGTLAWRIGQADKLIGIGVEFGTDYSCEERQAAEGVFASSFASAFPEGSFDAEEAYYTFFDPPDALTAASE